MKKIMTNEEKINKINNERKTMLEKVKANLSNNSNLSMNSIDKVVETVSYDEKNTKEYKAILQAKTMIANLTKSIIEAKTPEEIADNRRKINYYINKIKKILESRGVTPAEIENMSQSVNYMRKDMSEYIRFLKRENNINEIVRLNNNFSSLSEEEKNKLKRLLRNEVNYIKRKQINESKPKTITKNIETKTELSSFEKLESLLLINNESEELKEIINEFKEKDFSTILKEKLEKEVKHLDEKDEKLSAALKEKLNKKDSSINEAKKDNSVDRFETLSIRYSLKNLHVYNSSFGKNCVSLIKNIPSYISNKKLVGKMIYDYNTYHRGKDLEAFIEYTKEQNSIVSAIKTIFKKSKLFKREKECLDDHQECINWMDNYLVKNPTKVLSR